MIGLAPDLSELWLNRHHTLVSTNAHFTHDQAIPAAQYYSAAKQVVSPADVQQSLQQTHSVIFFSIRLSLWIVCARTVGWAV